MSQIIDNILLQESLRQNQGIELIASENVASWEVRSAMSTILTNKYAEGYPGKRYYGGCEQVDKIETYAIDLACRLFKCKYANVQPHSGSQANYAAYKALLPNGGKILSMSLNDGGHLTHGSPVSFSGHDYQFIHYGLTEDGKINYLQLQELARTEKPDLIVAGASSYPYEIDFKFIKQVCDEYNIKLMVDMAHIAGLVAAGKHQNPCQYADIVTSTTHKTLRGPRGGLILTNSEELIKKINSAVFPYSQGGPLMHVIAAKAICFEEALKPEFAEYIDNVRNNTKQCRNRLQTLGAKVSNTENHLFLLNTLESYHLNGLEAQKLLEQCGITTNKNMLPNDKLKPNETSGLRIGFAAVTTRGCSAADAVEIADIIHRVLSGKINVLEADMLVKKITLRWKSVEQI